MSANMKEEFSLEQFAAAIVAIRDEIGKINKEADKKIKKLEHEKEALEKYCEEKLEQLGSESVKTNSGTIMRQVKTRYSTSNWDEFYRLIQTEDRPELLEKRVHQTNFKEFLEENPDKEPKGLNIFRETKIVVRRG
jgi:hypothetical protein|tara:strand:- start:9971 stop:10378 length:408 start_codon:yes stop_codon:yes gene_type:complete